MTQPETLLEADLVEATEARPVYERDLERLANLSYTELLTRLENTEAASISPTVLLKILEFCLARIDKEQGRHDVTHQTINFLSVIKDKGLPPERLQALEQAALRNAHNVINHLKEEPE